MQTKEKAFGQGPQERNTLQTTTRFTYASATVHGKDLLVLVHNFEQARKMLLHSLTPFTVVNDPTETVALNMPFTIQKEAYTSMNQRPLRFVGVYYLESLENF